jgi:hypothetical protein
MRLTRAAQRAQQTVDEPITDATETTERSPLNEISPNGSPEQIAPAEELPQKTPARSKSKKGGKKGGKGKKGKVAEEEQAQEVLNAEEQAQEVLDDEEQAPDSLACDAAVENVITSPPDGEY